MKSFKNFTLLGLYALCAISIGEITTYFFVSSSQIISAIFSNNGGFSSILVFYLFFLNAISFVILVGMKKLRISEKIFSYFMYTILMVSLSYLAVFRFISIPNFEPFELIYVVNDSAMYGVFISLLYLIVRTECMEGIASWKIFNRKAV